MQNVDIHLWSFVVDCDLLVPIEIFLIQEILKSLGYIVDNESMRRA